MVCRDCVPEVLWDHEYNCPRCWHAAAGYLWCVACQTHHRVWPECPGILEDGSEAEGEVQQPVQVLEVTVINLKEKQ